MQHKSNHTSVSTLGDEEQSTELKLALNVETLDVEVLAHAHSSYIHKLAHPYWLVLDLVYGRTDDCDNGLFAQDIDTPRLSDKARNENEQSPRTTPR